MVSVMFACFETMNKDYTWASKQTVEESKWFKPVAGVVYKLTPYFEQVAGQVLKQ